MRAAPFTGGERELRQELEQLADPRYKAFHQGLIPGTPMTYGVRLPQLRDLARRVLLGDPLPFSKRPVPPPMRSGWSGGW